MWVPGSVWTGTELSFPPGMDPRNVQAFNESLYRLIYPGPLTDIPLEIINYVTSAFGLAMTLFIDKIPFLQSCQTCSSFAVCVLLGISPASEV